MEGTFTVRVEMIQGSRTRFDYISFDPMECAGVSRSGTTWGRIKTLWK